jgi:hypothetical protein
MDIECRGLLRITWDLVLREHRLLELMLPTTGDIAKCVIEERTPTPEQADAWTEAQRTLNQAMIELTAGLAELRRSVEPLIGFDA